MDIESLIKSTLPTDEKYIEYGKNYIRMYDLPKNIDCLQLGIETYPFKLEFEKLSRYLDDKVIDEVEYDDRRRIIKDLLYGFLNAKKILSRRKLELEKE